MIKRKTIVIALGGNALIGEGQRGAVAEQFENVRKSLDGVIFFLKQGYKVVITHGNGPQVGNMLLMVEASRNQVPELSLGVCVAETEGEIGYMIQQSLANRLRKEGISACAVTVLTQVVVDRHDRAFSNPTKPIGPFYGKEEADRLRREKGWCIVEDSHRGYRRVVASPNPMEIVEIRAIMNLLDGGNVVIAAGGGGIPVVIKDDGDMEGVDVVIDKDLASGVLARDVKAGCLMMLTGVEHAFLNFKRPDEQPLGRVSLHDARRYLQEGHFPPGSMGPKIQAAINFLDWGGESAIITSIGKAREAFEGVAGTRIVKNR